MGERVQGRYGAVMGSQDKVCDMVPSHVSGKQKSKVDSSVRVRAMKNQIFFLFENYS